jgi:hypothetical protein
MPKRGDFDVEYDNDAECKKKKNNNKKTIK